MTEAFILSSISIEKSLSYSFGNILPVELPLDDNPLLYHQLKFLENFCSKINLIIPCNYKSKLISRYKGDLNIITVAKTSLIDLFKIVSNYSSNQRVFILYGDTLFKGNYKFDNNKNYFFINKPKTNYNWGLTINENVPSGGMIYNRKKLIELLREVKSFDDFTKINYSNENVTLFNSFDWYDFGNAINYFLSKKSFLKSRYFNNILIKEHTVIKKSKDIFKIWAEYNWYQKIEKIEFLYTPRVKNFNVIDNYAEYEIDYVPKPTLSDIYVFGKFPDHLFQEIIKKLAIKINQLQEFKVQSIDNLMYEKLLERKDAFIKIINQLDENDLINIYNNNLDHFKNKEIINVISHGDFCFSNILFDFNSFEPIFIDPRGYIDRKVGPSIYAPRQYDIFKLAHSYLCDYDYIIHNFEVSSINFETNEFKNKKLFFIELFKLDPIELKFGLLNLFLTLLPLHVESEKKLRSFIELIKKIDKHKW